MRLETKDKRQENIEMRKLMLERRLEIGEVRQEKNTCVLRHETREKRHEA